MLDDETTKLSAINDGGLQNGATKADMNRLARKLLVAVIGIWLATIAIIALIALSVQDFVAGELTTVLQYQAILARPPIASYTIPSDIRAFSNDFVDIDSERLSFTLATTGRNLLAHFSGAVHAVGSKNITVDFDIVVDGQRMGLDHGIVSAGLTKDRTPVSFTYLIQDLSPGLHTVKFLWSGQLDQGMRLKAGAHFWLREV